MVCYRIKDWDQHFENNRTRELKFLDWVPIPNKMDGDGYTELVDHPAGATHFGAWVAIVEVASRCDPRGTLLRAGGRPHDCASLGRLTRLSEQVFADALPRLVHIGWLESYDVDTSQLTPFSHSPAEISQVDAEKRLRNGTERNGTERKISTEPKTASVQPDFSVIAFPEFPVVAQKGLPHTWSLSDALVSELAATYPGVDVPSECRKAWQWVKANLNRRKTARGMSKFLNGWMARQQDRGGSQSRPTTAAPSRVAEQKQRLEALK